jgi:hypothetical protein
MIGRALVAAVCIWAGTAQAQVRELISVPQGSQTVLQFSEPFSSASVGDPSIIDALPRSDRLIVIQGKAAGATDIVTFMDGKVLRHIAVTVQPASASGKVITHNKKTLSEYTAYSCSGTACARMKDDFEGKDVLLFGPGGTVMGVGTTGSSVNVGQPPR